MSRKSPVARVPGAFLRRVARLCFFENVYLSVFAPILDEMFAEYCAALAAGDRVEARFALAKGRTWFCLAVVELLISWIKRLLLPGGN